MTVLVAFLLAASLDAAATAPASAGTADLVDAEAHPAAVVSSFLDLPPGDELTVRHNSYSCHAFAIHDLTFRRGAVCSVTVVLVRSGPAGVRTPRALATLAVSDSMAMDLDELMGLYRAEPARPSNGGLRLELTQVRDGAVIAQEILPGTRVIRRLGDYGFGALISQARRAAPASAFIGEYR